MSLSNNIQKYRKIKGWSQEELAVRLSVSRQSVSKWELDEATPDIKKIMQMADCFEITVDELIGHKILLNDKPKKNYWKQGLIALVIFALGCCFTLIIRDNKAPIDLNQFDHIIENVEVERKGTAVRPQFKLYITPEVYHDDMNYKLLVEDKEYELIYENYQLTAQFTAEPNYGMNSTLYLICELDDMSFQQTIGTYKYSNTFDSVMWTWYYE